MIIPSNYLSWVSLYHVTWMKLYESFTRIPLAQILFVHIDSSAQNPKYSQLYKIILHKFFAKEKTNKKVKH